jgi:hypothetical protein
MDPRGIDADRLETGPLKGVYVRVAVLGDGKQDGGSLHCFPYAADVGSPVLCVTIL